MFRHIVSLSLYFFLTMNAAYAQQWQVYTTSNSGLPHNQIGVTTVNATGMPSRVLIDRDNNVWITSANISGNAGHTTRFSPVTNTWTVWRVADIAGGPADPTSDVFNMFCDTKNNIRVSLNLSSVSSLTTYRYEGAQWVKWQEGNDDISVYNLAEEAGNLWITASISSGPMTLYKYDGQTLSNKSFVWNGFVTPGGITLFLGLTFDGHGNLWVPAFNLVRPASLFKYKESVQPVEYQHPRTFINAVEVLKNDEVWVGTATTSGLGYGPGEGIARLDGTNWIHYHTGNSPIPDNNVHALTSDGLEGLWIGTDNGLVRFDRQNEWKVYNTGNSPLLSNGITGITIDTVGTKWIATLNGLVKFNEIAPDFNYQNPCFRTVEFQDMSASIDGAITTWQWDFDGLGTSNKRNPSFTFPAPGDYDVRLWMKDQKGNRNLIIKKITVTSPIPQLTLGADIQTCEGSATVVANFQGADLYTWHTPSGTVQGTDNFAARKSGEYILIAQMSDGCAMKDTVNISVNELVDATYAITSAAKDISSGSIIMMGTPITFSSSLKAGVTWSFGDNTTSSEETPVHVYEHPGTYTISLASNDSFNCPIGATTVITVQDLFIVTAISPNGDGKNDKFYIEPFVYNASLKITDRNGKTVYDAPEYHDDFTGEALTEGVYFYELYFREIDRRYKGHVHIVK